MFDVTGKFGTDVDGNSRLCTSVTTFNDTIERDVNHELRWHRDNRVAIAGAGYVNPSFTRHYVLGAGSIVHTDDVSMPTEIEDDDGVVGYRFVRNGGSDWNIAK